MTVGIRHVAVVAAGGLASALLGSGLIAVVQDSVTAPGNAVESPALAGQTADIQVGHLDSGTSEQAISPADCDGWSDTTVVPFTWWTGDTGVLAEDGPVAPQNWLCVRNIGPDPVVVDLAFDNVLSTDHGCGPGEEEVDSDCVDPGDPGELDGSVETVTPDHTDDNVEVHRTVYRGSLAGPVTAVDGFGCLASATACDPGDESGGAVAELAPGQAIVIGLAFDWQGDRVVSQTDRLQWDIVLSGRTAEAGGGG